MKNKLKRKIKFIFLLSVILLAFVIFTLISGCSLNQLFKDFIPDDNIYVDIEKINMDDIDVKSLEITDKAFDEKIDTSNEIKISSDKMRDPFMPFYLYPESDSETLRNKLVVEKIYSQDETFYTEINLNDSVYKLKTEDLFGKIYQVRAINTDSVVLLKGDEIITIYMNEIYYD